MIQRVLWTMRVSNLHCAASHTFNPFPNNPPSWKHSWSFYMCLCTAYTYLARWQSHSQGSFSPRGVLNTTSCCRNPLWTEHWPQSSAPRPHHPTSVSDHNNEAEVHTATHLVKSLSWRVEVIIPAKRDNIRKRMFIKGQVWQLAVQKLLVMWWKSQVPPVCPSLKMEQKWNSSSQ